eukprot:scaffold626757_cov35-Prasinocladus_malaysianus.AAC.1
MRRRHLVTSISSLAPALVIYYYLQMLRPVSAQVDLFQFQSLGGGWEIRMSDSGSVDCTTADHVEFDNDLSSLAVHDGILTSYKLGSF